MVDIELDASSSAATETTSNEVAKDSNVDAGVIPVTEAINVGEGTYTNSSLSKIGVKKSLKIQLLID